MMNWILKILVVREKSNPAKLDKLLAQRFQEYKLSVLN